VNAINYENLLVEIKNRIVFVTINRSDKLNALNALTKSELRRVFEGFKSDDAVGVVIITGAGEKAFA
jgi:enoyl-CoA hydratase